MLRVEHGGLRSGRLPLQPRVQLDERGLQRGDFSLWLRPAQRADAGKYSAVVSLGGRHFNCRLRLRVGQASSRWGRDEGERDREGGLQEPPLRSPHPARPGSGWGGQEAPRLRLRPKSCLALPGGWRKGVGHMMAGVRGHPWGSTRKGCRLERLCHPVGSPHPQRDAP